MKNSFFTFCLLLAGGAVSLKAQTAKYSNEFLSIGVGARALGMSNSVIATGDDVTAGYWNPAGLTGIRGDMQVGLMHSEQFGGIAKFDYGGLAKVLDSNSAFAVSIIRFGIDDIPNTTELIDQAGNIDYSRISTFSAADYAFIGSYARKTKIPGLRIGANVKIIHRKIGDFGKSWGFGLDASAQYNYKKWQFGAMARDITTTFNAWSYSLTSEMINTFIATGNDIPTNSVELTLPKLLLGGGRKFEIKDRFSVLTELDLDMSFDGMRNTLIKSNSVSIDPHFGFEAGYKNIVFLRGGVGNFQKSKKIDGTGDEWTFQPNIGVGVRIRQFTIDYALTDVGNQSAVIYSNVFSLRFDISKPGS